ncbi:MAG: AAA family ATPase [Anaerolineaceae bacterium]|jgi:hypothetical protein
MFYNIKGGSRELGAGNWKDRGELGEINFDKAVSAADLVRWEWSPKAWLLWQMIPRGGITLLAGEIASGKTFLGLDLANGDGFGTGEGMGNGIWKQGKGNRERGAGRKA